MPVLAAPASVGGNSFDASQLLGAVVATGRWVRVAAFMLAESTACVCQLDQLSRQYLRGRRRHRRVTKCIAAEPHKAASLALADRSQFEHAPD